MSDLSSQPTPIQTLYTWYREGKLIVNRLYQRKLVWTLTEKQKLVDSVLRQYPVPLILLAEPIALETSTYEIIDGLQRLHTLMSFIENAFDVDGKFFDTDEFASAKDARERKLFTSPKDVPLLSREEVSKILNYVVPVSIIRNAESSVVTDVFSRINSYGHLLSEQERRQAGQTTQLARFVRQSACEIRGDVSVDVLPLFKMPEISIDLQRSPTGYYVKASEVFWVRQSILRSTDLRDSLDEQIIADIAICLISGIIERSKDALDAAFDIGTDRGRTIDADLHAYGAPRLQTEIKYCLEIVDQVVGAGLASTLSRLIFVSPTNNSFATIFASIFIAIHEISFKDKRVLADAASAHIALDNLKTKMSSVRDVQARRSNVNVIKGLLADSFVTGDVSKIAFGGNRELGIDNTLRRSGIETPLFEMKQGLLRLSSGREKDGNIFDKVLKTICAISNVGAGSNGAIFIGIADCKSDAERIENLDQVVSDVVADRWIVGIEREAKKLGVSVERYYQFWRDSVSQANLSEPLKSEVLAQLDLCNYRKRSILIINVPAQNGPSFFNDRLYVREGDQTVEAAANQVLNVAARFKK